MGDRQGQRQDSLADRQGSRQDFRTGSREDWQNFHNDHYYHHHGWHNGCWHGSGFYWNHMWDNYPVYSAFRVTSWGINTASWMFGYQPYTNPYYEPVASQPVYINYSQPMMAESAEPTASQNAGAPPVPSEAALTSYDAAREAFRSGDYDKALKLTDASLKELPRDAVIHEFRALILFATGDYKNSAAGLYSVLSVGPGWDWTTMSGLYADSATYTTQLRALEEFVKTNDGSPEGHFVLGYHYMTCTHNESSLKQFLILAKTQPGDAVVGSLISMLGGEPPAESRPAPPSPAVSGNEEVQAIPQEAVIGSWSASGQQSAQFGLKLNDDGKFTWSFTQQGKQQSISGVFAIDGHVLAMEPDAGGTMLAEITLDDKGFTFRQIGAPESDKGLSFSGS